MLNVARTVRPGHVGDFHLHVEPGKRSMTVLGRGTDRWQWSRTLYRGRASAPDIF